MAQYQLMTGRYNYYCERQKHKCSSIPNNDYFSSLLLCWNLSTLFVLLCRCKCGNCETSNLANISECYCCTELDGCQESLQTEWVIQEVGSHLVCVTDHPGFNPVCLQKWSLRLSADRFKCQNNQRYRQTETEEK